MPSEVKPGHAEALVPHLYEFVARHPPLSGMARGRAAGDPSSYCPFRTLKWYTSFRDYIMTIDGFDAYLGGNQSRARTKKLMVELAIRQERAHRNTITLFFLMEYHQDVKGYLISTFAKFGNLGLTSYNVANLSAAAFVGKEPRGVGARPRPSARRRRPSR